MKRKTRRFDEGGGTTEEFKRPIKSTADAKSETAAAPKKTSFSSAFAAARRAGDKTFEWEGKKYGTALKGETSASKPQTSSVIDAGVAAAKDQEERRKQIRNITNSPRLDDTLAARNIAAQAAEKAIKRNKAASLAEQRRVADLQSTTTGRALTDIQAPRITKSMADNQAKENAYETEFKKRDAIARGAFEGQGYDYDAMKKGGRVKSASARADGCAIRGKTRA